MKLRLNREFAGIMKFASKIDVTDPCYDNDVWCRVNGVEVEDGDYECVAWTNDEGRVMTCGIYHNDTSYRSGYEVIGYAGVDAGLCGFFMNKPDFADDEWIDFLKSNGVFNDNENAWVCKYGFFTSSGYGDGSYKVVGHRGESGKFDALEIRFF